MSVIAVVRTGIRSVRIGAMDTIEGERVKYVEFLDGNVTRIHLDNPHNPMSVNVITTTGPVVVRSDDRE